MSTSRDLPRKPAGSLSLAVAGFSACGTFADIGLDLDGQTDSRAPSRQPIAVQPGSKQRGRQERADSQSDLGIPVQSGNLLPSNFWEVVDRGGDSMKKFQLDIPHVRQQYSWDCGIACVRMVLRYASDSTALPCSKDHSEGCGNCRYLGIPRSSEALVDLIGTRSVWTIDLAVLLRRVAGPALRFLFCTASLGASDSHSELDMYRREFDDDARRVNDLFRSAPDLAVPYVQTSLEARDLARLVSTGRVLLIVLLDVHLMRTRRHQRVLAQTLPFLGPHQRGAGGGESGSRGGDGAEAGASSVVSSRYTGHYVVICGYDSETETYTYLDPAQAPALFAIAADDLDDARFSVGTDEDILIVEVPATPADRSLTRNGSPSLEDEDADRLETEPRQGYSRYGSPSTPESQELLGAPSAVVYAAAARLKNQAAEAKDNFWRNTDRLLSSLFSRGSGSGAMWTSTASAPASGGLKDL